MEDDKALKDEEGKELKAPEEEKAISGEKAKNLFERNPKKTISVVLLILVICTAHIADRYYAIKYPKFTGVWDSPEYSRYIRLREFAPMMDYELKPDENYLSGKDGLKKKPYKFRTDKEGFIMPSKEYEDPDITIGFLGGSTTECLFVSEWNRYPYLTGKKLGKKLDKSVNTYNCGMGGNNTLHSINILINKLLPLKPDYVILAHSVSDLVALLYEDSYWNDNPVRSPIVSAYKTQNIYKFSKWAKNFVNVFFPNIVDALRNVSDPNQRDEFAQIRNKKIKIDKEYLKNEFRMNLQTFINICKARGITPVLLTEASRLTEKPDRIVLGHVQGAIQMNITYNKLLELTIMFDDVIKEVGRKNEVLVIDLANLIPKTNEYIYDAYHYNDNGSILTAELIADELFKLIKGEEEPLTFE